MQGLTGHSATATQNCGEPVSIIIPIYNAGNFLKEAIESVVNQTYTNWELILVDDGSTDGSGEFAKSYAACSPDRIRYVTHPGRKNRGMLASYNLGIACSGCDLIAFLDADDVWFPDKLEKQVKILQSQPEAALVYGQGRVWRSWSSEPASQPDYDFEPDFPLVGLVQPPKLLQSFLRNESYAPCPPAALIRKKEIDRIGGFDDDYRGIGADQVFWAKLLLESVAYVTAEPVFLYRIHPNSTCHTALALGRYHVERKQFLDWLQEYLACRIPQESLLWRDLQIQRRRYTHPRLDRILRSLKEPQKLLVSIGRTIARWMLPERLFNQLRSLWSERKY